MYSFIAKLTQFLLESEHDQTSFLALVRRPYIPIEEVRCRHMLEAGYDLQFIGLLRAEMHVCRTWFVLKCFRTDFCRYFCKSTFLNMPRKRKVRLHWFLILCFSDLVSKVYF